MGCDGGFSDCTRHTYDIWPMDDNDCFCYIFENLEENCVKHEGMIYEVGPKSRKIENFICEIVRFLYT